ncbi:MAG: HDIG domain-containing protein [Candidatus Bathyarchaeota archaeon]|nr:HDIG domain-containing protein [Candidatus Bathyarchaeota archaeon]
MSNLLPTRKEALELLRKNGCSKNVIAHCEAVAKLARETAEICKKKGLKVDVDLVEIGALLHDVGRSKTHSIHHVVAGVEIAKKAGLPDPVISIIKCHVGGGITASEAAELGWPAGSYVPTTLEEKIVSYADKLVETSERIPIEATINKLRAEKLEAAAERVQLIHDEVTKLISEEP